MSWVESRAESRGESTLFSSQQPTSLVLSLPESDPLTWLVSILRSTAPSEWLSESVGFSSLPTVSYTPLSRSVLPADTFLMWAWPLMAGTGVWGAPPGSGVPLGSGEVLRDGPCEAASYMVPSGLSPRMMQRESYRVEEYFTLRLSCCLQMSFRSLWLPT